MRQREREDRRLNVSTLMTKVKLGPGIGREWICGWIWALGLEGERKREGRDRRKSRSRRSRRRGRSLLLWGTIIYHHCYNRVVIYGNCKKEDAYIIHMRGSGAGNLKIKGMGFSI